MSFTVFIFRLPGIKILGLIYDSKKDLFYYKLVPFSKKLTKRSAAEYIAGIFDCLGYLAPITFQTSEIFNAWTIHILSTHHVCNIHTRICIFCLYIKPIENAPLNSQRNYIRH